MKQKTAMQELIEYCEYRLSKASNNNIASWNMILSKIKDDGLLEKEKQQIIDAFYSGADREISSGEEYFNQTYSK